jgi:hypothetical protein
MRSAEIHFFRNSIRSSLTSTSSLSHLHRISAPNALMGGTRRFCANFLKVLKRPRCVKVESRVETWFLPLTDCSGAKSARLARKAKGRKGHRAAHISKSNRQKSPRLPKPTRGSLGFRVLQWLVLSRESLQGLRGVLQPHLTQRTSSITHRFPLPSVLNSNGAGHLRPPGGSTVYIQLH